MLGAIAKIYTVIIHCIDTNSVNWSVRQKYIRPPERSPIV